MPGSTGPAGKHGSVGPRGFKGVRGMKGEMGETGAIGLRGTKVFHNKNLKLKFLTNNSKISNSRVIQVVLE